MFYRRCVSGAGKTPKFSDNSSFKILQNGIPMALICFLRVEFPKHWVFIIFYNLKKYTYVCLSLSMCVCMAYYPYLWQWIVEILLVKYIGQRAKCLTVALMMPHRCSTCIFKNMMLQFYYIFLCFENLTRNHTYDCAIGCLWPFD